MRRRPPGPSRLPRPAKARSVSTRGRENAPPRSGGAFEFRGSRSTASCSEDAAYACLTTPKAAANAPTRKAGEGNHSFASPTHVPALGPLDRRWEYESNTPSSWPQYLLTGRPYNRDQPCAGPGCAFYTWGDTHPTGRHYPHTASSDSRHRSPLRRIN